MSYSGDCDPLVRFNLYDAIGLPLKIATQQRGRSTKAFCIEAGKLTRQKIFEQTDCNMTVQMTVLEFVLEAAQAAIAGSIAVFGTNFDQRQRSFKQFTTAIYQLAREASAARKRVIEEDLSL